jgi:hypothetical protein
MKKVGFREARLGNSPMLDEKFLRAEVEPYIDNLYRNSPLLNRHRDTAIVHLMRVFSDAIRFGTFQSIRESDDLQFFLKLRKAQEGLPWAMRWIWDGCPTEGIGNLELNWDAYEEAGKLLLLAFDYYHLYRCFVLYSRGIFAVQARPSEKRIRFYFKSEIEELRDASGALYLMERDIPPIPPPLATFLRQNMPVINTILSEYIDKLDASSIRYTVPSEISELFKRWATVQLRSMRFDLPGTWRFGEFNLHQFRLFWKSLLSIALTHSVAHNLADRAVRTRGGAIGSLVINVSESELLKVSDMFAIPFESCRAILEILVYNPTRKYWDPIWQPLVRISDGTLLISPQLITTSAAERNLMILLGRNANWRKYYNQVSAEKERQQLDELTSLFPKDRYVVRKRVRIPREDGSTLSDVDVVAFDRSDRFLLLLHAKWLIRPDFVSETLAKDEELKSAIAITKVCSERIAQLGTKWLCEALSTEIPSEPIDYGSAIVNRDFIPSGWVYDAEIPVVDMEYLRRFQQIATNQNLRSLHRSCKQIDVWLHTQYPATLSSDDMRFGDYTFELPTFDQAGRQH